VFVAARMRNCFFLIFVFWLFGQITTVVSQEKCTVEGTVLDAADDKPLAGAEVAIRRSDSTSSALSVLTDGNGHYSAEDIAPGRYSIAVSCSGYVPQTYGQHKRNNEGTTLDLEIGTKLRVIDFRLVRTGVIVGKVLDQAGEAIVKATVQALTPRYVEGERQLIGGVEPTRTNDLGEYRIFGLAPDHYYVGVSGQDPDPTVLTRPKNAAADERYVPTLYPNVSNISDASIINLKPGEEVRGIDIVVSKSRTFRIRGKIIGFDKSYQNTRVQLQAVGVSWEISNRGADIAPDQQGGFEFTGITPGSYIISTLLTRRDSFLNASQLVRVQDADLDNISLVPSEGVLQGHVRVDGDSKIDLGKLHVSLAGQYWWPLEGTVVQDGSFTVHGLSHYAYRVGVWGAEDFYIKSVRIGGREVPDGVLDLNGVQDPGGVLEIILAKGGRIDGVVTRENGTVASNSTVVLIPVDRRLNTLFKNTATDQNGQFSMRGIAPGDYELFAWDDIEPGMWWDSEFLNHYEDQGQKVTIEANTRVSSTLHLISTDGE
jgi:Carboxypeptidase regulatory-like domain